MPAGPAELSACKPQLTVRSRVCLMNGNETCQRFVDTLWRKEAGGGSGSSRSLPFAGRSRSRRGGDDRLRVALRDAVPAMTSKLSAGARRATDEASEFVPVPAENKLTYPPPELRTSSPRPELFCFPRDAPVHLDPHFDCRFVSVRRDHHVCSSHRARPPACDVSLPKKLTSQALEK